MFTTGKTLLRKAALPEPAELLIDYQLLDQAHVPAGVEQYESR